MRKYTCFLFLIAFFSQQFVFPQPVIQHTDASLWFANTTSWQIIVSDTSSYLMDVGIQTSSAQSWTIPSFQIMDTLSIKNIYYSPDISIFASFASATHAQRSLSTLTKDTIYTMYRLNTDSLVLIGGVSILDGMFGGRVTVQTYSPVINFPYSVGQICTTRDSSSDPSGPNEKPSYTIKKIKRAADAFGTIETATTHISCIRQNIITVRTRYLVANDSLITTDTSTAFIWWTRDGFHFEALVSSGYVPSGVTRIRKLSLFNISPSSTSVYEENPLIPNRAELYPNYPNPFNPQTTISFSLPSKSFVSLKIFDALGREVSVVLSEELPFGKYFSQWNAAGMTSGVYFYRLQVGRFTETKKLLLLR